MPIRLAAILALLVFAVCLVVGGIQTGNPFSTTVARALAGMGGTFVVGWVIGTMAQKMLDENLNPAAKEPSEPEKLSQKKPGPSR
jgi:L-asparagine transporter-like permease